MKKSLLVLTLACSCVAFATGTPAPYDKLNTTADGTFGLEVSGSTPTLTDGAVSKDGDAEFSYAAGKMEVDSDIDNRVTFTTKDANGHDIVGFVLNLETAVVPQNKLPTLNADSAKVGFAVYNNGTTTDYRAWVGGNDWILLSGSTPKAEGEDYKLTILMDGREGVDKVQFKIDDGSALTYGGANWISCTSLVKDNTINVDFVGSGRIASLAGTKYTVTSEVIVIPGGGNVTVTEEDLQAFENTIVGTDYTSTEDFLEAEAKAAFGSSTKFPATGLKVAEAYALGLVEKNATSGKMEAKNAGALEIKAETPTIANGEITLAFAGGVTPRTDSGATITYQLQGSLQGSNDDTAWTNIGEPSQTMPKISTTDVGTGSGKYTFFKVVTKVTLQSAGN